MKLCFKINLGLNYLLAALEPSSIRGFSASGSEAFAAAEGFYNPWAMAHRLPRGVLVPPPRQLSAECPLAPPVPSSVPEECNGGLVEPRGLPQGSQTQGRALKDRHL